MTVDDAKRLQGRLGLVQDGIAGRDTYRALFARFGALPTIAPELGLSAAVHLNAHGIADKPLRLAHFMAQAAHESGGFRYMEEIWGPTDAQRSYEGRGLLGNTQPGDGYRFKGRGPIQLTGRANYRLFGRALGLDFEQHPEIVALPSVGLMAACHFWQMRGLNELADADDVLTITKRVNGGQNGLADRQAQLAIAKELLL